MVADRDITLTAVFERHNALGDDIWYAYIALVLAAVGALALGTWYVRHGRD